jgi:hypothetical protein
VATFERRLHSHHDGLKRDADHGGSIHPAVERGGGLQ